MINMSYLINQSILLNTRHVLRELLTVVVIYCVIIKEDLISMKLENLKLLLQIYISFLKLGFVSFGGGYSVMPLIQIEVVENRKWVEREKIVDIFAVSGSLPGAIALNSSTFVGYSVARIPGALAALLGNVTPSVFIVLILNILFTKYGAYPGVKSAFRGIYPVTWVPAYS